VDIYTELLGVRSVRQSVEISTLNRISAINQ